MYNGLEKINVEVQLQKMFKEYEQRTTETEYTYEIIRESFLKLSNNN